jgi:hypothetical protein
VGSAGQIVGEIFSLYFLISGFAEKICERRTIKIADIAIA